MANSGHFRKGADVRRRPLTWEDRSRGGLSSWWFTRFTVRAAMRLALPGPPSHRMGRKAYRKYLKLVGCPF